ncbi:hypothetical protein [Geodermatophilus sp. SYSU D00815]
MKSSMFGKVSEFAKSPRGQQLLRDAAGKAQQFAKDPKNRAKIEGLRRRFSGGPGGTTPR